VHVAAVIDADDLDAVDDGGEVAPRVGNRACRMADF